MKLGLRLRAGFYLPVRSLQVLALVLRGAGRWMWRRCSARAEPCEVALRRFLEDAGGTLVKIGQAVACRPDLFPARYCTELEGLFEMVPAFPGERAARIVARDLGAPIGELFSNFDLMPVAAASLGQVHRATGFDGRALAVKVLRPGIERIVGADVLLLEALCGVLWLAPAFRRGGFGEFWREIRELLLRELDCTAEARALRIARHQFRHEPGMVVPRVHERLSSRRVLTMDFVEGISLRAWFADGSTAANLTDGAPDEEELAERLFHFSLRAAFDLDFFHADPHPGNLLLTSGHEVALLDFGIVGSLAPEQRALLVDYFRGLGEEDHHCSARALERLLRKGPRGETDRLLAALRLRFLDWHVAASEPDDARGRSTAVLLMDCLRIARECDYAPPRSVVAFCRSVLILEPILYRLDPEFSAPGQIERYFFQRERRRLRPRERLIAPRRYLEAVRQSLVLLPETMQQAREALAQRGERDAGAQTGHRGPRARVGKVLVLVGAFLLIHRWALDEGWALPLLAHETHTVAAGVATSLAGLALLFARMTGEE